MPDDMMHGIMELVMGEQRDDEKIMLRPIGTGRRILCLTCATQLMQWMADGKHQFTLQMDSGGLSTSRCSPITNSMIPCIMSSGIVESHL